MQTRLEAARGLDKLLSACGHEETAARPLTMGQGKDKSNHLQEVKETEEEEGGASTVPRPEEKEGGLGRIYRKENPTKGEGHEGPWVPWRPLREGGEEHETGLLPDRLDTRNGPLLNPVTYYLER